MPDGNFRHAQPRPYAPDDLEICMWGHVADVINRAKNFLKIGLRVSEPRHPEKWPFPLKAFIALTTV